MNIEHAVYKIDLTPKNIINKNPVHQRMQGKECAINFLEKEKVLLEDIFYVLI